MNPERRGLLVVIAVLAISAILGGIYGPSVRATSSSTDDAQAAVRDFTKVLDVVQSNYAEPVDVDKTVYQGAIPGMLRMLDPHSNFYDPKAYAKMREDQRGHYYGVGMVIQQQTNKVYVITPYEGTPSFRAGIRPGGGRQAGLRRRYLRGGRGALGSLKRRAGLQSSFSDASAKRR